MPRLFDQFKLRGVTLRNRIAVSPMVQTSSVDGFATDWHLVHLGARAAGGAGLVMTEAAAIDPRGRISVGDLGIWKDEHIGKLNQIADFIRNEGAAPGIQLGHGGRKSSYGLPFNSQGMQPLRQLSQQQGAWPVLGASPIAFDEDSPVPLEMSCQQIEEAIQSYGRAATRAVEAGFDWIEVHAAHGYLPHCFYSPLSNVRADCYGGSFENRIRFTREVARHIRATIPEEKVLAFRLSYTDWVDGGWTIEETVELAKYLKRDGVDLIDVSSGGSTAKTDDPVADIPIEPGYQVPGAIAVRNGANVPVAAVGLITEAKQADDIVQRGQADLIMLARAMLRDPNWPIRAAIALGECKRARIPVQYHLAWKDQGEFTYLPISAPSLD
nr:NADPH dehydrogenase-like [Nerophis lumbriciformis]